MNRPGRAELSGPETASREVEGKPCPYALSAYRWHLNRAVVLRDEAGEILRFVGTSTDIDDLKQSQDDLRRANERTRLIIETALDAVVTMNSQGLITSWNKQAEMIFGWSPVEAIGRNMADMIIPDQHRTAHERGLRRFLTTGEGPVLNKRIEITALRRDGGEFPVELTITPLKSGDTWTFSSFIRDISDRRRAEERLRESELKLRNTQAELAHMARVMTMGELTASIAHEVNQPLAAIVASGDSCAAWLSNDPPNLEKARAATSRTIQAATQASEIVQRLRALFKKTTSMTGSVDINTVVEDTISLVHHETQRNRIFLRTELDPGVPAVSGDRVQLQQVVLNLVMNGIESIAGLDHAGLDHAGLDHEPKRLMIRSSASDAGELLVSVEDTGPGIQTDHTDRLFAPFFTTKPQGIGMGLPICRSIIEAHGGRLWAEKNQPRGAVFHFALPVTAPNE
jgi:PAS domain S-box-containing protein